MGLLVGMEGWVMWTLLPILILVGLRYVLRAIRVRIHKQNVKNGDDIVVAVFHPNCDAGGGGERVLWVAVQELQNLRKFVKIRIITQPAVAKKGLDVVQQAHERFGLHDLDHERIEFVPLSSCILLEPSFWPRFTLLGQSIGAFVAGIEAVCRSGCPVLFLDTIGIAFVYPFAWLCGCTIMCYTHYPIISTDMLSLVHERRPSFNNSDAIASSSLGSTLKYCYYVAFCGLYMLAGQLSHIVMVNSHWTSNHIDALWRTKSTIVYPPCDTEKFASARSKERERVIISLGQFRPEKAHWLQIKALAILKNTLALENDSHRPLPSLHMYGGCRNKDDKERIEQLREYAAELGVAKNVEFRVNRPFSELKNNVGRALIGIHTMWNEHFGIAPVEMLSAGVIVVAHRSGGPMLDIIEDGRTGYLAVSAEEYADKMKKILDLFDNQGGDSCPELVKMADEAQISMERFSENVFKASFRAAVFSSVGLSKK